MDLPSPDRAGFVDLGRMRLRVWEWGDEAAPPVICIHGAYDHGRMWDGFAPHLVDLGYRVLAPDVRGHGDSGRLSSGHIFAATALDLALLARAAGPSVGLVGHSFGGGVALMVAGVWPELVRWVVDLDGLGPPPAAFEEGDLAEAATRGLAAAERAGGASPRVYASRAEMVERRAAVNVRLPRPWVEHLVRHGSREVEGGFVWKADPYFSVGLPSPFGPGYIEAEHELVRCPVLVLTGGEHDTWSDLSPAEIDDRLSHLAVVRHEVVEGAGHYVHVEQPAAVVEAVRAFLAEVGS